jgi:hypothetical protein
VVEGWTNGAVFETYLQDVLCPTLKRGQMVVMDNLSAHKGEKVRELIEGEGCEIIYLPPYSPDFNPIEGGLLQAKELPQGGMRSQPKDAHGDHRPSIEHDHRFGCGGLLRTLWLPGSGSISMTAALASHAWLGQLVASDTRANWSVSIRIFRQGWVLEYLSVPSEA